MKQGLTARDSKVSVVVISYNQEDYIQKTIESICSQNYKNLEVIIYDDASTDSTQKIIEKTTKPYLSKIDFKLKLRKKNIGIAKNLYDGLAAATGDYIALCEGDDYWTDDEKIKIQTQAMDGYEDVSVCFHPVKVIYEGVDKPPEFYPVGLEDGVLGGVENLLSNNIIQTNSVMYRRLESYDNLPEDIMPIDWYLHTLHATKGQILYIDKVMAVYRRNPGGVWWDFDDDADEIILKRGYKHIRFYEEQSKLLEDNNQIKTVQSNILTIIKSIALAQNKHPQLSFENAQADPVLLGKYAKTCGDFISGLSSQLESLKISLKQTKIDLRTANENVDNQQKVHKKEMSELQTRQDEITNSRSWRFSQLLRRFLWFARRK